MHIDQQKLLLIFGCLDVLLTVFGFLLCEVDKRRARADAWRIPERRFFVTAFLGGGIGVLLGMKYFRHKTRHPSFLFGIPALTLASLLWQGALFYFLSR